MESWAGSTVKKNICHKKTIQYPAVYFGKLPQSAYGKNFVGGKVNLKNVLMRRRARKDLSAEHKVAGIVARMEATIYRTGKMLWRPF